VSGGSDKIHKFLKPFSVVDVRGQQVFQAVRRAKDVTEVFLINYSQIFCTIECSALK